MGKVCKVCGIKKELSEFPESKKCRDGVSCWCKGCFKKYRQENKLKFSTTHKKYRIKLRREILKHYGNKCACCGEKSIEFLAIDHINGGGNKHRKELQLERGISFYLWLKKNNFPEGFRILCHNCNQSLGHYGYCPHTQKGVRGVV